MENITEKSCELENDEVIIDLESSFNCVFEQIVEKVTFEENSSRNGSTSSSSELSVKSEDSQNQPIKRSQTNSTIVQKNLELHLRFV